MTTLPAWARRLLTKELRFVANGMEFDREAAEKLLALLAPRRKNEKQKKTAKRKAGAAQAAGARSAEVYAAVTKRANGQCECGCGRFLSLWGSAKDHWLGGSGRRKQEERVDTCWMLTRKCNAARTHNRPSVIYWNDKFAAHCAKYGYPFVPHIVHHGVSRRAS